MSLSEFVFNNWGNCFSLFVTLVILYVFTLPIIYLVGFYAGKMANDIKNKKLEEYEELKRENEILKESISIKKKRK